MRHDRRLHMVLLFSQQEAIRCLFRSRPYVAQYVDKVAWFNAKGYGFLSYTGGTDVFVHYSAIDGDGYRSLKENETVEFDVETGNSGKQQAARVKSLGQTAES